MKWQRSIFDSPGTGDCDSMRWAPVAVALFCMLVIAFGLLYTLRQAVVVAPFAQADAGRLHYHMKNITRFGGSLTQVRQAIGRAVFLDPTPASARKADWRAIILDHIASANRPRHIVALAAEGPDAIAWALPGAFWTAYAGVPVVFLARDALPACCSSLWA